MASISTIQLSLGEELVRVAHAESDALHARVRAFAEATCATNGPTGRSSSADAFEELALDIARFQARESPGLRRFWGEIPGSVLDLPGLPADTFRFGRVALHPASLDVATFRTSGTTQADSGLHSLRTLATYDALALSLARKTLFRDAERAVVVALCPEPRGPIGSSLNYMMARFVEVFDGRSRDQTPCQRTAEELAGEAFVLNSLGPDVDAIRRAARVAELRREPLVVLGAAFAFATLLEALGGDSLATQVETRLMITGGFKGRRVELTEIELRGELARTFGPDRTTILGEYGMTELTSQLYEAHPKHGGRPGHFVAPPWLKVIAVDPATGARVPQGEVGAARFIDLGNVDSVVVLQTDDLIVEAGEGIELRGRRQKAVARGCSLPYEAFLSRSAGGSR